mmetsp:Transcript_14884/g.41227  ORF Transcript_14884/g.41227 Transcript_14884/m.41227 type:complete len:141 (-) Transcript_14884:1078-1500(-)
MQEVEASTSGLEGTSNCPTSHIVNIIVRASKVTEDFVAEGSFQFVTCLSWLSRAVENIIGISYLSSHRLDPFASRWTLLHSRTRTRKELLLSPWLCWCSDALVACCCDTYTSIIIANKQATAPTTFVASVTGSPHKKRNW